MAGVKQKGWLALEDGTVFEGLGFGAEATRCGEVVFNTGMCGYQEILTDPSYCGQIVTMTAAQIGNYGANFQDFESRGIFLDGFVVKEASPLVSNWRSDCSLDELLKLYNVPGVEDIDTRKLTRHLRIQGAMRGCIAVGEWNPDELVDRAKASPSMQGRELASKVSCAAPYEFSASTALEHVAGELEVAHPELAQKVLERGPLAPGEFYPEWLQEGRWIHPFELATRRHDVPLVVVIDFGVKYNILRLLYSLGLRVLVVPASTSAKDILAYEPQGVVISNGPGDPEPILYGQETIRQLVGKAPMLGICLGQQLLGLALGGSTYKLKFGHHGINHPVMRLATREVEITSQNHGFVVDLDTLPKDDIELTHINLNDKTCEGIRHRAYPLMAVQYHPEHGPGPHDSMYIFKEFADLLNHASEVPTT